MIKIAHLQLPSGLADNQEGDTLAEPVKLWLTGSYLGFVSLPLSPVLCVRLLPPLQLSHLTESFAADVWQHPLIFLCLGEGDDSGHAK